MKTKKQKISNNTNKTDQQIVKIKSLVEEGIFTKGAHHKQWYLEQIAKILDLKIVNIYDRGIEP